MALIAGILSDFGGVGLATSTWSPPGNCSVRFRVWAVVCGVARRACDIVCYLFGCLVCLLSLSLIDEKEQAKCQPIPSGVSSIEGQQA